MQGIIIINYCNYLGPDVIIVFILNGILPAAGDYLKLFSWVLIKLFLSCHGTKEKVVYQK